MATQVSMEALNHVVSLVHHEVVHHEAGHEEDPFKVAKELSISVVCILGGVGMALSGEKLRTPGLLLVFFGAQTGMNMYMKAIFSTAVVSTDPPQPWGQGEPWLGFQASFFVTAMQQLGSFFLFFSVFGPLKYLGATKYELKVLQSKQEVIAVLCFAASFTLNIALNNFSLMLIPLTMNLIIRQCLPLSTYASQWVLTKYTTGEGKPIKVLEIALMLVGVSMAAVCVWAKVSAAAEEAGGEKKASGGETSSVLLGVAVCVLSLFSGSVNLALAGVLGTSVKLDSAATVVYNSLPATILLVPFILFMPHPVNWPGFDYGTDFEVAKQVWQLSKGTFALAFSSSLASLVYNILQFGIVQYLSATHVAFAGNFNKAATLPLALAVGIDTLPAGKWGIIMIAGAVVNICAFTAYNVVSGGAGGHGGGGGGSAKETQAFAAKVVDDGSSDDDSDEDSEGRCGGYC